MRFINPYRGAVRHLGQTGSYWGDPVEFVTAKAYTYVRYVRIPRGQRPIIGLSYSQLKEMEAENE